MAKLNECISPVFVTLEAAKSAVNQTTTYVPRPKDYRILVNPNIQLNIKLSDIKNAITIIRDVASGFGDLDSVKSNVEFIRDIMKASKIGYYPVKMREIYKAVSGFFKVNPLSYVIAVLDSSLMQTILQVFTEGGQVTSDLNAAIKNFQGFSNELKSYAAQHKGESFFEFLQKDIQGTLLGNVYKSGYEIADNLTANFTSMTVDAISGQDPIKIDEKIENIKNLFHKLKDFLSKDPDMIIIDEPNKYYV